MRIKDPYGRVEVDGGFVTFKARNLTLDAGHKITATRSNANAPFGVRFELSGQFDAPGMVLANSNWGGGAVDVRAAGNILLPPGGIGIEARATSANAPGGRILLSSGGDVVIDDTVTATAMEGSASSVAMGGTVAVIAARTITVGAKVSTFGKQAQAGSIALQSLGTVGPTGLPINPSSLPSCSSPDQTSKIIVQTNAPVSAEGGNVNGDGGAIHLAARSISTVSPLSAQGGVNVGGGNSSGGSVTLSGGDCDITIGGDINVRGGEKGSGRTGGAIQISSAGNVTIGNGVKLITRSEASGGDGGDLSINAGRDLTIQTGVQLDATGHTYNGNEGNGASIELAGCNVTVQGTASIDASGYQGGSVTLTANDVLTVSSSANVRAQGKVSDDDGEIVLHHRFGSCSGDPSVECSNGACELDDGPGLCSNDDSEICDTSADCTIGSQTGQCLFGFCTNDDFRGCNSAADCQNLGCPNGSCIPRYATSPETQFHPAPVHEEDGNLKSCL